MHQINFSPAFIFCHILLHATYHLILGSNKSIAYRGLKSTLCGHFFYFKLKLKFFDFVGMLQRNLNRNSKAGDFSFRYGKFILFLSYLRFYVKFKIRSYHTLSNISQRYPRCKGSRIMKDGCLLEHKLYI